MKATKKIVGAACALVAAVALSAGSTFAWFSANNKVDATGMKVQVIAPTDLNIAKGIQTNIAQINEPTIDFTTESATQKAINPVRIEKDDDTNFTKLVLKDVATWTTPPTSNSKGVPATYKLISEDAGAADITKTSTAPGQNDVKADYVYLQPMSLANKGAKDIVLDAKVTLSGVGTDDDSIKFLKCGFLIYTTDGADTPAESLTWTYMGLTTDFTQGTVEGATVYTWTQAKLIETMVKNQAYNVEFVVWFDGDDDDCIVNNALYPGDINIKVDFTAGTESGD